MIDPLENTHTRRVRDRRPTKAMRGCATRLRLSLSLSFALKKSQDDEENIDAKKIDIHGDISKYLSEFKKITHPERGVPAQIIARHHHISRPHHSRPQSRTKKRTFLGAAGTFAPLKDDDLFADEDGARIVASGWTVSVEDNIYSCVCVVLCV